MTEVLSIRRWISSDCAAVLRYALGRGVRFSGPYASWGDAAAHARGYGDQDILARATAATEEVRSGRAAYDRDGVAFPHHIHPFPLLTALLRTASDAGGRLSVLDFGGALGSSYFQCRSWLHGLDLAWTVVEQPHFVSSGNSRFASNELHFAPTIREAVARSSPNLILLSSVLQYMEDARSLLEELVEVGAETIVIARTPVVSSARSLIAVQRVPRSIVESSYPARLFARDELLDPLTNTYRLVAEYDDEQDRPIIALGHFVRFRGYINRRETL